MRARVEFDGNKLREVRKEAKFTQQELADKIGISRETVIAIENSHMEKHKASIRSLEVSTLKNWYGICEKRISDSSARDFKNYVINFLKLF